MRHRAVVALVTLPLALAACARRSEPAPGADASRQTAGTPARPALSLADSGADTGSVAHRVVAEIARLRDGVSLAAWRAATAESLATPSRWPPLEPQDLRCTTRERIVTGSRSVLRRYAVFFPPVAPASAAWPTDTGTTLMERACTLGLMWVEVAVQDTTRGARLADSILALITQAAGPPERDAKVEFSGSAYWLHRAKWRRGSATIVLAVNHFRSEEDSGRAVTSVITFAFTPVSRVSVDSMFAFEERDVLADDTLPLARAVALSGVDTAAWTPLKAAVDAASDWREDRRRADKMPPSEFLIAGLGRWLRGADSLPPERRAAALFVADQALDRTLCPLHLCDGSDSAKLAPLRALGAQFHWDQLGASWVYTRNWLIEARTLSDAGPIGDAAYLIMLEHAFDFSATCAGGSARYLKVIADGEAFLGRHTSAPNAVVVHFLVAEAYSDIVALAHGAGYYDETDSSGDAASSGDTPESQAAARNALVHYREVIRLGDTTAVARAAWIRAFRLLAGVPPTSTRFYCVYD